MQTEIIRVLIADDDEDFCLIQKCHLEMEQDIVCCGIAYDGKSALQMILETQPDVVLLDEIMPFLDGLGVLEYMREHPTEKQPRFIVSSANGYAHIIREMMEHGADYFLEKPYDPDMLARRIRFVHRLNKGQEMPSIQNRKAAELVRAVGVPTRLIGYEYIQKALLILLESGETRPALKQIYCRIAEQCSSDPHCVENAISSALRITMEQPTEALREVMALFHAQENTRLSNGKFLTMLAQKIRLSES